MTRWADIGKETRRRRGQGSRQAWTIWTIELAVALALGLWVGYWLARAF